MHNELTQKDIELMRQELEYRRGVLRPKLIEDVKTARAFGDLSENFEYKAAKQEKNKNEGRIRFLERTLKTARVVEDRSAPDAVGLYDKVTVLLEDEEEPETYQIVTTLRQDVLRGIISKESPMGRALMGRRVGDRAVVELDREKPGQAVQAPPGRKRTAAGIAPGAALWFHLFIFSNSDRIAKGIIKRTSNTNIFIFTPPLSIMRRCIVSLWGFLAPPGAFLLRRHLWRLLFPFRCCTLYTTPANTGQVQRRHIQARNAGFVLPLFVRPAFRCNRQNISGS